MRHKWHTARHKVLVRHFLLIQDTKQVRGNWKLVVCIANKPRGLGIGAKGSSAEKEPKARRSSGEVQRARACHYPTTSIVPKDKDEKTNPY